MSNIIEVKELNKIYKLYDNKKDRLKEAINFFLKTIFEQF